MDSDHQTPELTQSNENPTNWFCMTSMKLFVCYFEYFKETEENNGDVIRSNPADSKELTCSTEEYQQSVPILREHAWHEQLCKCHDCLQFYQKQNVEFLFGIKNIECLPTEIILKIFTHLLPSDRRVVSECCKRFLEIWLCDDFIDDRRLVFDCCVLDPEREPLSVFMKSSRNYRTLVIGDVKMSGVSIFEGKFGENVTSLELTNDLEFLYAYKNISFFSQFPNLKTIKVAYMELLWDFSHVPTTIEFLVSSKKSFSNAQLDFLKCYLDKKPDSFRIELNILISTQEILNFTESQRNKIQRVGLRFRENDVNVSLPRFDNLKYLELNFEGCYYGAEKIPDNIEEQFPAVKDISITIDKKLPHKNWTCLKTLDVHFIQKEEMSRFSIFENLKKLKLETRDKCFFGHETFLNKNLKTLETRFNENPCFTCFQTMTKSFPDLENFNCNFEIPNTHLEELATNTPKLKSLKLCFVHPSVSFAYFPNLTKLEINFNNLTPNMIETWPLMLNLRKLDFSLSRLNFETVKIFERMPALEDLKVSFDEIYGDQLALFKTMTNHLKRLKYIYFRWARIQPEIYSEIIDVMASNCKYLQRINFYTGFGAKAQSKEVLKQLLQKHSSIRCIDLEWLNEDVH